METNEIPLARELEFLDLYTGIQRRRFGDRLAVEIHADDDTLQLPVPPLILQPLVENAIHHGIGKHKGEDLIEIFAHIEDGGLQIEVWNGNSVVEESGRARSFCVASACGTHVLASSTSMDLPPLCTFAPWRAEARRF